MSRSHNAKNAKVAVLHYLRDARLGAAVFLAIAVPLAGNARADVVVTPNSMGNWAFANADGSGAVGNNPGGSGGMVTGPATPPLGVGSANLATGNGTVFGDGAEILSNSAYAGTPLSSITALSYSTYVTLNNGSQFPYLQLEVETSSGTFDQLFFEPPYQTPSSGNASLPNQGATAPVGSPAWQTWNALEGGWWDNNGTCGSQGAGVVSLSACSTALGDPTIVNSFGTPGVLDGVGGLQFDVGFASPGDQFNGYVDAVSIGVGGNTTTFDFEPLPEPASIAMFGAALAGLAAVRRRFRRR